MSISKLEVQSRTDHGSRAMKRLRDAGLVPAVLYGLKQEPRLLQLNQTLLESFLRDGSRTIELKLENHVQAALLKDVQYDHLGDRVIHADFQRLDMAETIQVRVPVKFTGMPKGQSVGGIVEHKVTELEVECLPGRIPDELIIALADLDVGQSLHVRDLDMPEGVKCLLDPEAVVASVTVVSEDEEEAAAEGEESSDEPEVIHGKDRPDSPEEGA